MIRSLSSLFLLFAAASAVANYAPAPVVTPAPSSYGSPYGNYPASAGQGQAPHTAQPFQTVDVENYGVPALLPSVSGSSSSTGTQPASISIPPPIPPPVPSFAQQPLGVSVPVNQPVGFSQQVTVTNPQALNQQGYAPPPPVAPASSAYGAPSSGYGSASSYGNYPFQTGRNIQTNVLQRPSAAQPIGLTSGFTQTNVVSEPALEGQDEWEGFNINTARGVKTQSASKA